MAYIVSGGVLKLYSLTPDPNHMDYWKCSLVYSSTTIQTYGNLLQTLNQMFQRVD